MVILAILGLSLSAHFTNSVFAEDEMTAEKVIEEHVKSMGTPQALAALKSLAFVGSSSVEFIQGMYGKMNGTSMLVSDGKKIGIVVKYGDIEYPGEYLAYDGEKVSVGHIDPLQRSPLADFVFRHNGIMKEGLLGGVFSGGWPLPHLQEDQAWLKYDSVKVDDRRLHEIEYRPKRSLRDVKIKLYFDPETFHHVRTEYRVRIRDDMSAGPGGGAGPGAGGSRTGTFQRENTEFNGMEALIQGLPDSIYVLIEKFYDFKKVGAMTLPHGYSIDYSVEGQGHTFIGKWTLRADQWAFNRTYDDKIFIAQK
jgi:hypothetical protein